MAKKNAWINPSIEPAWETMPDYDPENPTARGDRRGVVDWLGQAAQSLPEGYTLSIQGDEFKIQYSHYLVFHEGLANELAIDMRHTLLPALLEGFKRASDGKAALKVKFIDDEFQHEYFSNGKSIVKYWQLYSYK